MVRFRDSVRGWETVALVAIVVVAVTVRVWQLDSVPPGLTHDEASNGHDGAAVLDGVRPIYFTVGYGHEPLYPYSVALLMALLGPTSTVLRLTTVLWGTILIVLSYLLARRLFGSMTAILTAAWMAVSFWCLMTSRVGLRAITTAVTFTASAYGFWRAITPRSTELAERGPPLKVGSLLWCVLSGVFLGASIYTYMASRAMPAVYLLFLVYLFALDLRPFRNTKKRQNGRNGPEGERAFLPLGRLSASSHGGMWHQPVFRQPWFAITVLLITAAVVAAPLVHYLIEHPEAEQRVGQLSAPLKEAARGRFGSLWDHVVRSLPMFTFKGDPLWLYNIPGRPLLDVVGGAFFYAGLLVCLWRWRDPHHGFMLLWLIVGVSPALVTGPDATVLRSIAAQPAVFIVASLGLVTVVRFLHRRAGSWGKAAVIGAVAALFIATAARTVHAYFNVWAQHRDVRVAYHHTLVEEARYLDAQPENGTVALSSIYPGRFHDPYTMEVALHRDDLSLHWFDARFALVFPPGGSSRVIIPSIAPLDEALRPVFAPYASLLHTERLRPDDLIGQFDVYRFDSDAALRQLLQGARSAPVYWSRSDTFPTTDPRSGYRPLDLPVNVGNLVDLVGYDLRTPRVEPGGEVELLTVWRVREGFGGDPERGSVPELVAFAHVLSPGGSVLGQQDRLDVPSWHWTPGGSFVQLHRFPIDESAPTGLYPVQAGFYARGDGQRLPVVVDGTSVDDRILLRPLEVKGQ